MITETTPAQSSRRTKRRGRHPHHALAPAFVRTAPPGHHIDGHGLYLYVQPTGARSWIQRLVIRGRRCELGLGAVALVSLAEAREQAVANRKLARAGGDPLADSCLCRSLLIRQPFVVRTATRTSAARLCQVLCAGRSRECARPPQRNVERDRAP